MITFTKILQYDLRSKSENAYEYIAKVSAQEVDPPSLKKGALISVAHIVLHSPLRRAIECIKRQVDVEYMPMDELKEIPFNLRKMCTEDEWKKEGSNIVRKRFKDMFVNDTLLIPRKQIFDEIKIVLQKCQGCGDEDILVVSHSFRLKIIEGFIITKGKIEEKPELIFDFIQDDKKTFGFGEGFGISVL